MVDSLPGDGSVRRIHDNSGHDNAMNGRRTVVSERRPTRRTGPRRWFHAFLAITVGCYYNSNLVFGPNEVAERSVSGWLPGVLAALDPNDPCKHEKNGKFGEVQQLRDSEHVYKEIGKHMTHRYQWSTYNVTVFNQPDAYRNVIINLEPCKGVVYLFVRRTRLCYPNPYSCIDTENEDSGRSSSPKDCEWTHYMSAIDGTRDGGPTFFELPLTSTRYFISVFAKEDSRYTLVIESDIGSWPRPGNGGQIEAFQLQELQIKLSWWTAGFYPPGISEVKNYHVYSAILLDSDKRTNSAIFLTKDKIMNTVCGLKNNTDEPVTKGDPISASRCHNGRCNATIDGVLVGKRYVFNVVAQSARNYNMSYAGLILKTDWTVVRKAAEDFTLGAVAAVCGSVLGLVVMCYLWMINLYGK